MSKPIATVSSDWHLELAAWRDHPGCAGDSYYGLQQIVDKTVELAVPWTLALGDLFNVKYPDAYTVRVACRETDKLQAAGIVFGYVSGQHELNRTSPWMAVHPWARHLHRASFDIAGISFYALDWLPSALMKTALADTPRATRVLLTHAVWREVWNSPIVPGECSFKDVPANIQLLCTGDYHVHGTKEYDNNGGRMLVGSPGSICLQAINEMPDKYMFVLYDDLTLESVPLKSRAIFTEHITTTDALARLLSPAIVEKISTPQAGVPDNIGTNILRVIYDESVPDAYAEITRAFKGQVHLFTEPRKAESPGVTVEREARRAVADGGLLGALDLVCPAGTDDNRDLRRLLGSPDAGPELDAMRDEFVAGYKENKRGTDTQ